MAFDADNADLLWPLNTEPPIPAIIMAQVVHDGQLYTLTCVRSNFRDEGFAILERIVGHQKKLDFAQHGEWRIKHPDEGPSELDVDFDDSGDVKELPTLLERLLAQMVRVDSRWGFESWTRQI